MHKLMNEKIYAFEKLEVWQLSRLFVTSVYKLIAGFPHEEKYALCDQIRRAAVSVPSNIAEGSSRTYPKEQKHFIEIAYILAQDLGYVTTEQVNEIKSQIDRISQMLNALRASLNKRLNA